MSPTMVPAGCVSPIAVCASGLPLTLWKAPKVVIEPQK